MQGILKLLPAVFFVFVSMTINPLSANNKIENFTVAELSTPQGHGGENNIQVADEGHEISEDHGDHHLPPIWAVIPFILILLMIATGPLFYAHFWHKNYPIISILLGALVVFYYIFFLDNLHQPIHSLAEYLSFIALLASLFVASGGILIKVDKEGRPIVNVILLIFGSIIANLIGTTGASMLLIRPFIRLNQNRIKPYQIIFFIFMVSNVGGALTPIGDPPLFLGFLKGVPFFWTVTHIWPAWIFGIGLLALMFYFIDSKNYKKAEPAEVTYTGKISIKGKKNFLWLGVVILAVFIDPNVFPWVPGIEYEGTKISFIREIIMLTVAFFSYTTANKECLKGNEFDFEPIREVAFLFIGIFGTMMPALQLVGAFAQGEGAELVNTDTLYWFTGSLSAVLDNAPTYLNFLAAGMAKYNLDINNPVQVTQFANEFIRQLSAISISAVFFGAMTYIGNGPNFMVKSIAEQVGISMPSFFGYVIRYSLPILLPILFLTYVVFFLLM